MKTYKYRIYKIQDGNCNTSWRAYRMVLGLPLVRLKSAEGSWVDDAEFNFSCEASAVDSCKYDALIRRARNYTIISSKDISV